MSTVWTIIGLVFLVVAVFACVAAVGYWRDADGPRRLSASLTALWYRLVRDPEPYDKNFAEAPDPVDEVHDGYQRAAWFTGADGNTCPVVPGNHPLDCWERCCIDIRVAEFDWHAAEHEMRSKR
jgi:hypothetical protein